MPHYVVALNLESDLDDPKYESLRNFRDTTRLAIRLASETTWFLYSPLDSESLLSRLREFLPDGEQVIILTVDSKARVRAFAPSDTIAYLEKILSKP